MKNNVIFITLFVAAVSFFHGGDAQAQQTKSIKNTTGDKYDTKLPVEISSDNLEVLQHENKAIFKGNVLAVQGKIRLKADTMIVHYKQKSDEPGSPTPVKPAPVAAPASSSPGSMGAITLIEVEGNVLMATPEESAKGDRGNYKVDEKLLHLTGDNVILTRDKNILRGTELVYNLETGRSVLTNKGATVDGTNDGRVRGVFVPTDDKDKTGAKKTKPIPGTTGDTTPATTSASTSSASNPGATSTTTSSPIVVKPQ